MLFMEQHNDKLFELIFVECSRLVCSKNKKEDDKIKLWREMNDGLYFVYNSFKPNKDEFGILGIQVAADIIHFNILIKGLDDINKLYNLYSTKIPVQLSDTECVLQFVETLLNIRNIIIVNISLLLNALEHRTESTKRKISSTVASDSESNNKKSKKNKKSKC